MKIETAYPVYISTDLVASKNFYCKWFSFEVYFESSFFILLTSGGSSPSFMAFLAEEHPSSPPDLPKLTGNTGVFLTLQVADSKTLYDELSKKGLDFFYPLTNEKWGQRRFGVIDPNGMYVDIVEQTEPEAGFWDKYILT